MKTFCLSVLAAGVLAAFAMVAPAQSGGPTIGAPNGVSYEVTSTREVTRMDGGRCGYHDLSLPNGAVFRVETRVYREFKEGKLLRTWQATAELFVRCYEP